jgi:hypothetical protein
VPEATAITYLVIAGGGMPYVVCPAAAVRVCDDTLLALTLDLEALSGWTTSRSTATRPRPISRSARASLTSRKG